MIRIRGHVPRVGIAKPRATPDKDTKPRARRKRPSYPKRSHPKFSADVEQQIVAVYAKVPAREVGKVLGLAISHQGVLDIVRRHGGVVRVQGPTKKH